MTMQSVQSISDEVQELKARIGALRAARLSTANEERALAEKESQLKLLSGVVSQGAASIATEIEYEDEVDKDAFDSAGNFASPSQPCRVNGMFKKIIIPTGSEKHDQRWWVFKTDDDRILQEKGRQIESAIVVSPRGQGAFKLKEILTSLGILWDETGNIIRYKIPQDLPCILVYTNQTFKGKTEVRLESVELPGATTPVIG